MFCHSGSNKLNLPRIFFFLFLSHKRAQPLFLFLWPYLFTFLYYLISLLFSFLPLQTFSKFFEAKFFPLIFKMKIIFILFFIILFFIYNSCYQKLKVHKKFVIHFFFNVTSIRSKVCNMLVMWRVFPSGLVVEYWIQNDILSKFESAEIPLIFNYLMLTLSWKNHWEIGKILSFNIFREIRL